MNTFTESFPNIVSKFSTDNNNEELNLDFNNLSNKEKQILVKLIRDNEEKLRASSNEENINEPILNKENRRFTVFPIQYQNLWDSYKKQEALFWKAEEIDFSRDYDDFQKLNKDEQHFIKMILAFFAASDGIINFNLRERFLNEVEIMEAQVTFSWQMMMENIHGLTYSLMLDNIIKDPEEKHRLFNAIDTIPSVKRMADWAFKWIESDKPFAYRVVAFAIIEGVFFSGAFAAIFWLKRYRTNGQYFLNGLIKSNEFIARDEGMHCEFGCELYKLLNRKLTKDEIYEIMDEGVNISKEFINDAIPCKLIGMNVELMSQYIEYIGDRLLTMLGYDKKYNTKNPFDWIETIGYVRKTNFFENRPSEYQSAHNNNIEKKFTKLDIF